MRTLVFVLFASTLMMPNAHANSFRSGVLEGFKEKCLARYKNKDIDENKAIEICQCETKVLDDNNSSWDFIVLGVKSAIGSDVKNTEKAKAIRKDMAKCRQPKNKKTEPQAPKKDERV
ncbi:hypothetical protein C2869_09620 [Saccharobesus litoralis]|uniref:Uncharacterized protein n=1 Tax=Saccharobesus litoralis TaxID=2172099 RepID=A0A2S0VR67_9ALTE|nr:hypothetical protein [Saccharobesus litoralis]AWB66672.1 hypothetical protein C2869_09620 [Saccharobesus litoralis]